MNTVNKVRNVVYVTLGFKTSLTDVVLSVRQPDATLLTPVVTEQGNGVYTASYTPTQVGTYQELISSVTNADKVLRSVDVVAVDDSDVKADVDAVATAVAAVKTDVDNSTTAIQASVATVKSDVDSVSTKVDAVQTSVNQIVASEAKSGGYFA
jgi:hypothetical protein